MNNEQEEKLYANEDEKRYTHEEIWEMFKEDNTLPWDFRSEILSRLDATYQAMYNCVNKRSTTMFLRDTWSDRWVEEHNRFVTLFQHYQLHPQHYVTLKLSKKITEEEQKKANQ